MTAPTPGPWKAIVRKHDPRFACIENEYGAPICPAVDVANARLIAQAPAMWAALERLSKAVAPTREGKRDGGTFGNLSIADDEARAILREVQP